MVKDIIQSIISAVETVAPKTWDLLVREQVVSGYISLAELVLIYIVVLTIIKIIFNILNKSEYKDEQIFTKRIVLIIAIFFAGLPTASIVTSAVGKITNPEVFAAKSLVESITK